MTAINVVFKKDRVHLLTDGAVYTGEGMPLGFTQKAMAMPSLNAALAIQGTAFAPGYLAQAWSATFRDFDHFMENAEGYILSDYRQLETMHGGEQSLMKFRLAVVGWSDADAKPMGFTFDNTSGEGVFDTMAAYPGDWRMTPDLSQEEAANLEALNVLIDGNDFTGAFDPVRHGIPLMEAQRRMRIVPIGSASQEEVPIVGGYILSTEVSASGITQKVIHRWNDDAGRIIEPEAFVRPEGVARLASPSSMNRQQRRAWERKHGRAAA